MSSPTVIVLLSFIGWTLLLLLTMEIVRSKLVIFKEVAPDGFNVENSNLSPFVQRLTRAHANCLEGLPIFGGLMLVAIATSQTGVTDQLAWVFLSARVLQSIIHLMSITAFAITLRFSFFVIQLIVAVVWFVKLMSVLL